jgi:hypothetical protein
MTITLFGANEIPIVGEAEDVYSAKAQAFAYGVQRLASEINAEAALENASTTTTSASSNSLTAGDKTFAVATGLGWASGIAGIAAVTGSSTQYAPFICKSYSGSTLIVTFGTPVGAGTFTTWTITKASGVANVASLTNNTFTGTQNWAEGASVASATTVNLSALTDGNTRALTGITAINAWTIANGAEHHLIYTGAGLILNYSGTTNRLNSGNTNLNLFTNDRLIVTSRGGFVNVQVIRDSGVAVVAAAANTSVEVRQAIQYGPRTASGQPDAIPQAQVGNTLAAGVSLNGATSPIFISVGQGYNADGTQNNVNRIINTNINPGPLTANSTTYFMVNALTGATTLNLIADSFQRGGSISSTSNVFTYDYLAHIMYVGTGAIASPAPWICVAEIDTNATVVTAIRVRQYGNLYHSGFIATLVAAAGTYTLGHNFGTQEIDFKERILCTTTDQGFAVGRVLDDVGGTNAALSAKTPYSISNNTVVVRRPSSTSYRTHNATTGADATLTAANWSYAGIAKRNF